jgi:hypothetical protein
MAKKIEELIPYIAIGFILGALLFMVRTCMTQPAKVQYIEKTKTKIDTQFIAGEIPKPVVIEKKITLQRVDTVFLDKKEIIVNPFNVCLDTITETKDTVKFCYSYPEEKLLFTLKKPVPQVQVITITKDNYVESSNWEKALYFVGGALTMYLGTTSTKGETK